jgi:hypothetical protein
VGHSFLLSGVWKGHSKGGLKYLEDDVTLSGLVPILLNGFPKRARLMSTIEDGFPGKVIRYCIILVKCDQDKFIRGMKSIFVMS